VYNQLAHVYHLDKNMQKKQTIPCSGMPRVIRQKKKHLVRLWPVAKQ